MPGLLACLALRYDASRATDMRARARAAAQAITGSLSTMNVCFYPISQQLHLWCQLISMDPFLACSLGIWSCPAQVALDRVCGMW